MKPAGVWSLDGEVVVPELSWNQPNDGFNTLVARKAPGGEWALDPMGAAVTGLGVGTVSDGELWLAARVAGVSQEDFTWQILHTRDGARWGSLGPIKGLQQLDNVTFLTRIDDIWVAGAYYLVESCCDGGGYELHIVWSEDGVHWTPADVPRFEAAAQYMYAARYRESIVVVAVLGAEVRAAPAVLRSGDGKTWRMLEGHQLEIGDEPSGLACTRDACVVVSSRPFCDCADNGPTAHVLSGSTTWNARELDVSDAALAEDGLRITAVGRGFLALAGSTGQALVSVDGSSWQTYDVMGQPAAFAPIAGIAQLGDSIFVATVGLDESASWLWTGDLTQLGL